MVTLINIKKVKSQTLLTIIQQPLEATGFTLKEHTETTDCTIKCCQLKLLQQLQS